jgi:arylsulfatase A-like enzyme
LKKLHARSCERIDKPVAGLIKDLKRRGLMDDVLVVFCTEFGRTPAVEDRKGFNSTGRDHHPHGFTVWLAGAGLKRGVVHGATDELGFHAVEQPHYVTDIHATVLHLMGLDPTRLEVPGRKRLDVDRGNVIREILA